MYTYAGNIHIHSTYSDGGKKVDQIAADAAKAGLDYIIITDHETLAGKKEEGIRHGVVVLVGIELNRRCNHYLALNCTGPFESNDHQPQQVIDQVREQGGFGFLAHPFEKGSPYIENGMAYPWLDWPVEGFAGLEIWNYCSHWRGKAASPWKTLYWYFFNRNAAIDAPPAELLKLWDCYNRVRHVTAIGGTDAHGTVRRFWIFKTNVFSYRYLFTTINTYIQLEQPLSANLKEAAGQIYGALQAGCCYLSFDRLLRGQGFMFQASTKTGRRPMGSVFRFEKGILLSVRSPARRAQIRLFKDGILLKQVPGDALHYGVSKPGAYRVEVYYRPFTGAPRPWIYSNAIYIR